ncbi:MAG: HEAT repeat domain-containing protein [Ignavibacteriae bacterium]|nr:HEAT repeat domain-containing protein [Ignavibacteria bacterium]MBI3364054.1 HEAT repeat domain-containing protein [Ignavibacteriota bacterium]
MNTHERWNELLQLSLYDELMDKEKQELDGHLQSCTECRAELVRLKALHARLDDAPSPVVDDRFLSEARQQLGSALRSEQSKQSLLQRLGDFIKAGIVPQYKIALGGALVFALGMVVAYALFVPRAQNTTSPQTTQQISPVLTGETRVTNVRFLNTDMATGEIEFAFEAVKSVRMKGNINDEQVQKILTHALLTDQNAGVRLQSISAMASRKSADKEIKNALVSALKTDENPGVRQEALKALQGFQMDQEIKQALLFVLTHEKNPGLRIAAINYLDSARVGSKAFDQDVLNVLRDKMQSDDNNYIRLRAKAAVEEVRQ